jgi:hypothetical protein
MGNYLPASIAIALTASAGLRASRAPNRILRREQDAALISIMNIVTPFPRRVI